ncbi:mitogen-activated protein kinase kinase kinase 2 [Biomphalaria glabrata]|nr:mitogen-activated protein kinase kinase kinase 2 [Biomphalaria glabrata]
MSAVHHEMTSESTDSTMSLESTLSDEVPKTYQLEDVPFGEGAQGKVYRLKNDERFVVKKISVQDATKHKDLRELNVLRTLDRHERIVPFYGYVPLEFELLLFMGFMKMVRLIHL